MVLVLVILLNPVRILLVVELPYVRSDKVPMFEIRLTSNAFAGVVLGIYEL